MTREGHTTIGVRVETRDLLRWLSAASGESMSEIVSRLVEDEVEAEAEKGSEKGVDKS